MRIGSFLFLIMAVLTGCSSDKGKGINPLPNFDAMWDYSQPDSTEMRFRQILPLLEKTDEFAVDLDYRIQLLTQIARAQGLQGKFHAADSTLKEANKILTDDMPVSRIRYLLEKGRLFNSLGETEEARAYFLDAYELGLKKDLDLYTVDAAHMMGIVEPAARQMEWNLMALEIAEKSQDERCRQWLGALYNNIGWTYFDQQDYLRAYKMFLKGFEWRQTQEDQESTRIAKWAVARSLRALFRFDEALHIMLGLEDELVSQNLPPDGYVYEELAELYLVTGNQQKAQKYFSQAYELLSQDAWLTKNDPERLRRLRTMGNK